MPQPTGRGWGTVWVPPRGTPLYMAPELFGEQNNRGCVQVGDADLIFLTSRRVRSGGFDGASPCACVVRCSQVSQMCDVYSFGVLLAFLFTGQHSPVVPPDLKVGSWRVCTARMVLASYMFISGGCCCRNLLALAAGVGGLHDPCVHGHCSRGPPALLSAPRLALLRWIRPGVSWHWAPY
jgi:serine/threonine protein kinase